MGHLSGASLAAFYACVALPNASLAAFYAFVAQMGGPVAPKLTQLTHFTHVLCIYLHFGPVRRPHVAIRVPLAGIRVLKTSHCVLPLCSLSAIVAQIIGLCGPP